MRGSTERLLFLINYEMSRPEEPGIPARSKQHFDRAMALSQGQLAGPMVYSLSR